ncbi:MAG: hypothetical protein ACLFV5_11880, partial [Anaerolineales bacterium]
LEADVYPETRKELRGGKVSIFPDQEIEAVVYRRLLKWGSYLGLALLILTFVIYVSGLVEPYIPLTELDDFWTLSVHEYTEAVGLETGWGWLGMLRYADFLNFVAISFLAAVTIICYIAIIPVFLRNGKTIYAGLAIAQVLVLVLAASGILGAA